MSEPVGVLFDRSSLANHPLIARQLVKLPALNIPNLREDVRALACRDWEDRTRAEYIGVMIVRKFHSLLVDLGAPMDLQELALVMLLQEQRHAALCMACACALGSDGEVAFELPELQQSPGPDLEQDLVGMVVGTYGIGEVVALALLRHTLRALPASPFRDTLRQIQRDEVLHARIGDLFLQELQTGGWFRWPGDAFATDTANRTLGAMRTRDVIEPDTIVLFGDPLAAAQLLSVGIPEPLGFRSAYHRALDRIPKV